MRTDTPGPTSAWIRCSRRQYRLGLISMRHSDALDGPRHQRRPDTHGLIGAHTPTADGSLKARHAESSRRVCRAQTVSAIAPSGEHGGGEFLRALPRTRAGADGHLNGSVDMTRVVITAGSSRSREPVERQSSAPPRECSWMQGPADHACIAYVPATRSTNRSYVYKRRTLDRPLR